MLPVMSPLRIFADILLTVHVTNLSLMLCKVSKHTGAHAV